jgi:hypothetical protein
MNRHPAFGAVNAYERLKHAFGRYTKLCGVLGELAEAFENFPELSGNAFDMPAQMVATLPEVLLARALAEEGLALVEQITWDAHLIEEDRQLAHLPDRSDMLTSLQKIKSEVESRKPSFELMKEQMNNMIEITMTAAATLSKLGASLRPLLESGDPRQLDKVPEVIQTILRETEVK